MKLYDHIDTASKYKGPIRPIEESVTSAEPDKTAAALNLVKRLAETPRVECEPKQLTAWPVAN